MTSNYMPICFDHKFFQYFCCINLNIFLPISDSFYKSELDVRAPPEKFIITILLLFFYICKLTIIVITSTEISSCNKPNRTFIILLLCCAKTWFNLAFKC